MYFLLGLSSKAVWWPLLLVAGLWFISGEFLMRDVNIPPDNLEACTVGTHYCGCADGCTLLYLVVTAGNENNLPRACLLCNFEFPRGPSIP